MRGREPCIEELQRTVNRNVFVMMRYADTPQFRQIEASIRSALERYGLIARLAKDRALSDDLWENIRLYMGTARYGIAVFEEIERRDFNPNISLELGYMYALGRRCLLLKASACRASPQTPAARFTGTSTPITPTNLLQVRLKLGARRTWA
jgi:hypothetical protein